MIDPHEYELTDEEREALLLKSEHAIAPPLSPAASAVLDAFGKHPLDHDNPSWGLKYGALPAALRAAALYCKRDRIQLLSIADELEQV